MGLWPRSVPGEEPPGQGRWGDGTGAGWGGDAEGLSGQQDIQECGEASPRAAHGRWGPTAV